MLAVSGPVPDPPDGARAEERGPCDQRCAGENAEQARDELKESSTVVATDTTMTET
jgi:hypothetical protein